MLKFLLKIYILIDFLKTVGSIFIPVEIFSSIFQTKLRVDSFVLDAVRLDKAIGIHEEAIEQYPRKHTIQSFSGSKLTDVSCLVRAFSDGNDLFFTLGYMHCKIFIVIGFTFYHWLTFRAIQRKQKMDKGE